VKVTGEVGFPGSVLYESGRDLDYYVLQAGGFTDRSDHGRVKLVQANGKVKKSGHPDAGALIVVPAKPPDVRHDTLKDMAAIVGIIAGATTTIFLAVEATK
jgi:protein involved in polysaccharide export with SLBB domain